MLKLNNSWSHKQKKKKKLLIWAMEQAWKGKDNAMVVNVAISHAWRSRQNVSIHTLDIGTYRLMYVSTCMCVYTYDYIFNY